ncbi:hypothetical protein [Actinacidiphila guanduensis]|uniref:Uncharacterized protein n=1 Tax=Actinacidiphila guanduensis TaxID=310781 RepID=A0A1H0FQL8_9ACTN|nr:hypothetical protein [Actinacidiphila guanduensis]SDN96940.1 hypothetical protein SAMN05216259_106390 [Actinacidiphila guanduensis]
MTGRAGAAEANGPTGTESGTGAVGAGRGDGGPTGSASTGTTPPGAGPVDYEGRRFRQPGDDAGTVAVYHQQDDLVWGEVAGGRVRRGWTAGTRNPDGTLSMGYTIVFATGEVVCGRSENTPELTGDGRLRLRETWERYGPHAATGVSYIEEVA